MSEQPTYQEARSPADGVSDKGFRIWQWILGCAGAIAVFVALILSVTEPSLTYKSVAPDFEDEITVSCSTSGDVADYPQLADPASIPLNYEITDGADVFEAWQKYEAQQNATNTDVFAASRGINADCARADTARLRLTMWVLALALALGVGLAWVSISRTRNTHRFDTETTERAAAQSLPGEADRPHA